MSKSGVYIWQCKDKPDDMIVELHYNKADTYDEQGAKVVKQYMELGYEITGIMSTELSDFIQLGKPQEGQKDE